MHPSFISNMWSYAIQVSTNRSHSKTKTPLTRRLDWLVVRAVRHFLCPASMLGLLRWLVEGSPCDSARVVKHVVAASRARAELCFRPLVDALRLPLEVQGDDGVHRALLHVLGGHHVAVAILIQFLGNANRLTSNVFGAKRSVLSVRWSRAEAVAPEMCWLQRDGEKQTDTDKISTLRLCSNDCATTNPKTLPPCMRVAFRSNMWQLAQSNIEVSSGIAIAHLRNRDP
jgi:hypothetical protein